MENWWNLIVHLSKTFRFWQSSDSQGVVLTREFSLPFTPYPGLCLKLSFPQYNSETIQKVTYNPVSGEFECELEPLPGLYVTVKPSMYEEARESVAHDVKPYLKNGWVVKYHGLLNPEDLTENEE